MTNEIFAILMAYLSCSASAEDRMLSYNEARSCSALYEKLKLSFLPEVNEAEYHGLPAEERSSINRRAYVAYVEWKAQNADFLKTLRSEVRSLHAGKGL